jgi:hypothetical protein
MGWELASSSNEKGLVCDEKARSGLRSKMGVFCNGNEIAQETGMPISFSKAEDHLILTECASFTMHVNVARKSRLLHLVPTGNMASLT